jgi:hypothetical protein
MPKTEIVSVKLLVSRTGAARGDDVQVSVPEATRMLDAGHCAVPAKSVMAKIEAYRAELAADATGADQANATGADQANAADADQTDAADAGQADATGADDADAADAADAGQSETKDKEAE